MAGEQKNNEQNTDGATVGEQTTVVTPAVKDDKKVTPIVDPASQTPAKEDRTTLDLHLDESRKSLDNDPTDYSAARLKVIQSNLDKGYTYNDAIANVMGRYALHLRDNPATSDYNELGEIETREELAIDVPKLKLDIEQDDTLSESVKVQRQRALDEIALIQQKGMAIIRTESGRYWLQSHKDGKREYAANSILEIRDVLEAYVDKDIPDPVPGVDPVEPKVTPDIPVVIPEATEEPLAFEYYEKIALGSLMVDFVTSGTAIGMKASGVGAIPGFIVGVLGDVVAMGMSGYSDIINPNVTTSEVWQNLGVRLGFSALEAVTLAPVSLAKNLRKGSQAFKLIKKGIQLAVVGNFISQAESFRYKEILGKSMTSWTLSDWKEVSGMAQAVMNVTAAGVSRKSSKKDIKSTYKDQIQTSTTPAGTTRVNKASGQKRQHTAPSKDKFTQDKVAARTTAEGKIKTAQAAETSAGKTAVIDTKAAVKPKVKSDLAATNRASAKRRAAEIAKNPDKYTKAEAAQANRNVKTFNKQAARTKVTSDAAANKAMASNKTSEISKKKTITETKDAKTGFRKDRKVATTTFKNRADSTPGAKSDIATKKGATQETKFSGARSTKAAKADAITEHGKRRGEAIAARARQDIMGGPSKKKTSKNLTAEQATIDTKVSRLDTRRRKLEGQTPNKSRDKKLKEVTESLKTARAQQKTTADNLKKSGGIEARAKKIREANKGKGIVAKGKAAGKSTGRLLKTAYKGTKGRVGQLTHFLSAYNTLGRQISGRQVGQGVSAGTERLTLDEAVSVLKEAGYSVEDINTLDNKLKITAAMSINKKNYKEPNSADKKKYGGVFLIPRARGGLQFSPNLTQGDVGIILTENEAGFVAGGDNRRIRSIDGTLRRVVDEDLVDNVADTNETNVSDGTNTKPEETHEQTLTNQKKAAEDWMIKQKEKFPEKTVEIEKEYIEVIKLLESDQPKTAEFWDNLASLTKYIKPADFMPTGKLFVESPAVHDITAPVLQSSRVMNIPGFEGRMNRAQNIRKTDSADAFVQYRSANDQYNKGQANREEIADKNIAYVRQLRQEQIRTGNANTVAAKQAENENLRAANQRIGIQAQQRAKARAAQFSEEQKRYGRVADGLAAFTTASFKNARADANNANYITALRAKSVWANKYQTPYTAFMKEGKNEEAQKLESEFTSEYKTNPFELDAKLIEYKPKTI